MSRLSKDLQTRIDIKRVDFSLFNKMHLQGVLVEDRQQDTLLYAGEIRVRITDWFFLRKNVELKYVGMDNAIVNMQRTDSTWNHQFILDYFSSPTSTEKKKGGIQLSLKEINLNNVVFRKKDAWVGQDMYVSVGGMRLDAKDLNFSKKLITITSLSLDAPHFSQFSYAGNRPVSNDVEAEFPKPVDSLLKWNSAGWVLQLNKLEIKNGSFKEDKNSEAPLNFFDGKHIYFSNINGSFNNVHWEKDTITAAISLDANERSGFQVKKLAANLKMTPEEMAFNDLDLQTNNSRIRNFFRMSYDDFGSMSSFISQVRMQANFVNSEIDSDDIAFFAPGVKTWKKSISLQGSVRGTVEDLYGRDLVIQAGRHTLLNGDVSMTGLPDINQTFIDFKANDFRTTYTDAVAFVPAIRNVTTPDLRQLEFVRFNGSFTGFIRDFVTFGTIQTNMGTIRSDLNMKLPAGQEPVYSGTVSTDLFRLGEFINDPQIGSIAMNGSVKGRGFKESTRSADVDGKIRFVDFRGYRYSNINLKGRLDKKLFDGMASIADPEAELVMNGLIDFNQEVPVFNFTADVKKANLRMLQLTNDSISFMGKFNLNFTGDNIDNFLGYANISDASIMRNGVRLPFDSLVLSSEYANNQKILRTRSNEFEASVTGDFTIRDLPDAVKLFLNRYYPSYIKPPAHIPQNQSLTFDITTQYVDEYIKLIDSSLSGFNNSHIYGKLDTRNNEMALTAEVPQFGYKDYEFADVRVSAEGTTDSLELSGSMANVMIGDSLNIPMTSFHISARNDSSQVNINTGANLAVNQASLNAQVLTFDNGVKIEFNPSSFVVNGKTWTIDDDGELEFRSNVPAAGQLVLKESNQEIRLRTQLSSTGDWNDLVVDLRKVNLGDIGPLLMPKNRIEGLLSGTVLVEDPMNNLHITSDDIITEGLRLDNDSIGDVRTNLVYDGATKHLTAKGRTLNEERNLAFDASIYLDPEKAKDNLIALEARTFDLKILERFLGNLFSNIEGYVTGNFALRGEFQNLQITGKGLLKDAGLKVNFTQCYYKINDTELELTPTEIKLDGIVLTDPVTGNPVYLTGGIQHDAFKDMFYDLTVSTRRPGTVDPDFNRAVLLLNTSYNDNKQFYGRVLGTGSFSLSGPQSDMFMKIDAIASSEDSSIITIPPSQNRESGIADFLVERKYGREMIDSTYGSGASNVIYDVDVTANRMLTVRVVLDDLTGDEIKGKGSGTLNIHSGSNEPLTMRGKYDIEDGEYLFTFQSIFKRPFKIRQGATNNISWNGDPYSAQINFEAVYTTQDVSFAPLVTGLNLNPSLARQRENVDVIVQLTGELFKPQFAFDLDFGNNSVVTTDFEVASSIQQMERNPGELSRQVTYLIVFNSFAPPENSQTNGIGAALSSLTYSTLSGLFFTEINRKLNSELAKILKTDNVSINFSGSVYNRNLLENQSSGNFGINQSNFNVNVPISLFKDRFVVTLGSTLDVPLQSTIQQNVQFLPDVTAEWLINQSGTIRASFFYRQNLDYLTSSSTGAARNKRSGASIAYRKEFDNLREFFGGRKKKAMVDSLQAVPKVD